MGLAFLPDYFLADRPSGAPLTPGMMTEACLTLKRNRLHYLVEWPTRDMIGLLGQVAENWLQPDDPFRRLALEFGPAATRFSAPTLAAGLDAFFSAVTPDALEGLVLQDLGHLQRLDRFVASEVEDQERRTGLATSPELMAHIAAGNLPAPVWSSLILGLLTRSAQFVKCGVGASLLPRLFAHSIYAVAPKIASCLEIAEWPGGTEAVEAMLFQQADCVTVHGTDETVAEVRRRVGPHQRFLGYGHRVSFAYVSQEMLSWRQARQMAAQVATDVGAWDQQGCLSPHVVYVEHGGSVTPEDFAGLLSEALAKLETDQPRGPLAAEEAAAIATRRSMYELRAAQIPGTRFWCSEGSTAWTVVHEADPQFQYSCLNRFVYVKGVKSLADALEGADAVRDVVSTVGLAARGETARELAMQLARWGVTRICPLGQMQRPPLTWRHDGRPGLGDLIAWTDWEHGV